MKKKVALFSLVSYLLICGVLNLILFLTIPDARLEEGVFWLAWSFTFPLNLAVAGLVAFLVSRRFNDPLIHMPPAYRVTWSAFGIYLVLGAILMYCPIVAFTVPIILEVTLTAFYVILILYLLLGAEYISKNQAHTKQKVLFVRLLRSDLEACFHLITDPALLADLRALSEKIRFSDPMSHPSLAGCEAELNTVVMAINQAARNGEPDQIPAQIKTASGLLDQRNSRCAILK